MPPEEQPQEEFQAAVAELRRVLQPNEKHPVLSAADPASYSPDTRHILPNRQPLFFASGKVQKNTGSFYLMPMYAIPDLLEGIAERPRKRMQGKPCFNFKNPDPELFAELKNLTRMGFERYKAAGYLG